MTQLDTQLGRHKVLHQLLIQESFVSSNEEASAIIDTVIQEHDVDGCADIADGNDILEAEKLYRNVLYEYFGLNENDVTTLLKKYIITLKRNENNTIHQDDDDDDNDGNNDNINAIKNDIGEEYILIDNDNDDDREDEIGPGECALCERDVTKLTRHHLIPKSTWKRIESMILTRWNKAITAISYSSSSSIKGPITTTTKPYQMINSDMDELDHVVPILLEMSKLYPNCSTLHGRQGGTGKRLIRDVLHQQTIDICRPCHNHIHKSYDNRTLALQYNTLHKLLQDPTIVKYAKWANKQHRFKIR